MPARSRSFERAPSAATSRLASTALPSASVTSTPSARESNVVTAAGAQIDALGFRALHQCIDQMAVLDHMRERLARLDIARESQEHRTGRILQLRVGDDHVEDRLRSGRDLIPHPDGLEQPAAGRDDGGRAWIAAWLCRQRRIGNDDRDIAAEALTQRQRQRQPRKGAAADNNASLCRHRNLLADTLAPGL